MTIGPAPMIMIEAMSVRLGIRGSGRAPTGAAAPDSTAYGGCPAGYTHPRPAGNTPAERATPAPERLDRVAAAVAAGCAGAAAPPTPSHGPPLDGRDGRR